MTTNIYTEMTNKYEVKGVIENIGHDLMGFKANLYSNGKKVAILSDNGYGHVDYYFDKKDDEKVFFEDMKLIEESEKAKGEDSQFFVKEINGKSIEPFFSFDSDTFVSTLIDKHSLDKMLKRNCKKNILFQIGDEINGFDFRTLKGIYPRGVVVSFIEKKYPNQKYVIANDEYTKGFL